MQRAVSRKLCYAAHFRFWSFFVGLCGRGREGEYYEDSRPHATQKSGRYARGEEKGRTMKTHGLMPHSRQADMHLTMHCVR